MMRKYQPGRRIKSMNDLLAQDFVYWNDKITPRGWFMSWQIYMAQTAIEHGIIRIAKKKENVNGNTDE